MRLKPTLASAFKRSIHEVPLNRNAVYAGCLAGIAVVAALFYPLYVVLPAAYIADWQTGSETLGLILSLVAAIVSAVGGMLAARWGRAVTRRDGMKLGALAGGIAGTIAFAALGAAAAGTVGLGSTLLRGVAGSTVDAIIQTANFTYMALWGLVLGGATLGALGGLLSPPGTGGEKQQDESGIRIAEVLSIRLLLVSLLILVVSVTTTPMLLSSENASQLGGVMALFNESVASGFAFYLAILLWILRLARNRLAPDTPILRKRQVNGGLWFASVLSLLALAVMVIALLSGNHSSQETKSRLLINPIFLTGALVSLALSSYVLKMAISLSNELRALGGPTPAETSRAKTESGSFAKRENILLVALIGGAAFALPPLTLVPLVVNLARGVMPTAAGAAGMDTVQDMFRSQALAAYGVFLVGALTIVCSISIAQGLSRFRERARQIGIAERT